MVNLAPQRLVICDPRLEIIVAPSLSLQGVSDIAGTVRIKVRYWIVHKRKVIIFLFYLFLFYCVVKCFKHCSSDKIILFIRSGV